MKKVYFIFVCMLSMFLSSLYAQDYCMTAPIGYGAGATGGSGGQVVKVATQSAFNEAITASGKAIVLVEGTITFGAYEMIKAQVIDKTIIGLPGAKLLSTEQSNAGGILEIKDGSDNIIIRNLIFEGPGAYDVDGNDLLYNRGTNVWVDHCEFYDGVDGNFDISNKGDNITVSWCKFGYNKPAKEGGSGGSPDHRFSNLVGGDDGIFPDDGRYSVTFMNCWWADGCKERMPRARNAEIHLLNNYVSTYVPNSLVMGFGDGFNGLNCYTENCHFERVDNILNITSYGGDPKVTITGCDRGNGEYNGGSPQPAYPYTALPYTDVKAAVAGTTCGAGATLNVTEEGVVSAPVCLPVVPTPEIILMSMPETETQSIISGGDIQPVLYAYRGSANGFDITYMEDNTVVSKPEWLSASINSNVITFAGTTPGLLLTPTDFTIVIKATDGAEFSEEMTAVITVIPATPILPVNVTAEATGNSITVNWDEVYGAEKYMLKVCGDETVPFGLAREWDFTGAWTINASTVDENLSLYIYGNEFFYKPSANASQLIFANGTVIPDVADLRFTARAYDRIRLGFGTGRLRLCAKDVAMTIPCSPGDIVEIKGSDLGRGFSASGGTLNPARTSDNITSDTSGDILTDSNPGTWAYNTTSNALTVRTVNGGLYIYSISVYSTTMEVCTEYEILAPTTSKTVSELKPDTEYFYQLKAVNDYGESAYSAGQSITTQATSAIDKAAVSPVQLQRIDGRLIVSGIDVKEMSLYSVSGLQVASATGTSISVSTLPAGVYIVKIIDREGGSITGKVIIKE